MIALVLVLHHHPLAAQEARHDSLWQVDLPNVVVTATKGAKERRNVPVPTQVITRQDVAAQGGEAAVGPADRADRPGPRL